MPAEQPNPHGDTLDTLRTVLSQLQAAMVTFPKDPTLAPAVSAVAQAVALLASLPPTADEANGGPSGT